jgi:hypothetical protein
MARALPRVNSETNISVRVTSETSPSPKPISLMLLVFHRFREWKGVDDQDSIGWIPEA